MLDSNLNNDFVDTWDIGDPIHECQFCKAMMWSNEQLAKSKNWV